MSARSLLMVLIALPCACTDDGSGGGGGGGGGGGTIQFSSASYSVSEGAGMATITVQRVGGAAGAAAAFAWIGGGTATSGQDYPQYIDYVGSLQWADGDASDRTFTIPITDDALVEPDETATLTLTGGPLGTPSTAILTIVDNDSAPSAGTLQFSSATYSVSEGAGMVTVTVTRRNGSAGSVGVFVFASPGGTATAGQDYPQYIDYVEFLQWADGDVADKTFTVPVFEDAAVENDETFGLTLSGPTGGATLGAPSTTGVTIVDND